MVIHQLSLKVEREYIIASPFADDQLPTFTKGRKKITNTNVTANGLPTIIEGRKRIYHSIVVH